uniref:Uncharacterized protein n=1 Tax=Anopheles melas TaxID=34690 RepID=A0A182TYM4_9DIPT
MANLLWSIIWLIVLIVVGFWVAFFCAGWYVLIYPLTVCVPDISGECSAFEWHRIQFNHSTGIQADLVPFGSAISVCDKRMLRCCAINGKIKTSSIRREQQQV